MTFEHDPSDPVHRIIAHLTERQNEQSRRMADLEARLAKVDRQRASEDEPVGAIDAAIKLLERCGFEISQRGHSQSR